MVNAQQILFLNCSSSPWTSLHHMVILGSQNKITDFFIILAWACPFNHQIVSDTQTWSVLCTWLGKMDSVGLTQANQCWFIAGPPSATSAQHWINIVTKVSKCDYIQNAQKWPKAQIFSFLHSKWILNHNSLKCHLSETKTKYVHSIEWS